MFKSTDLPYIIQFAVMFHNDKPVDWLLDPIIETRYCPHDTVNDMRRRLSFFWMTSMISFFLMNRRVEEMQSDQAPQVGPLQTFAFPTCGHNVITQRQSSET